MCLQLENRYMRVICGHSEERVGVTSEAARVQAHQGVVTYFCGYDNKHWELSGPAGWLM